MTDPDVSRPREDSRADATLVARGITVAAVVDVSTEFRVVVRPDGGAAWATSARPGDDVELYWLAADQDRSMPTRITEVEAGVEPRWHLAATGPARPSQRRRVVRGRVALPVYLPWLDGQLVGETVDLSEAGARCLLDGWGLPPELGTHLDVSITLDEEQVHLRGEVVRQQPAGARWMLSVGFRDVPDRDADLLRRRVFQALREERALAD